MYGFAERERALYIYLKQLIILYQDRVIERRIASVSLSTGELFEKNDVGKFFSLCENLYSNKLCSVLYAAGELSEELSDADSEKKTNQLILRLRKELGDLGINIENRELLKEFADKDLSQGTTLVYCVAELENFLAKHPNLPFDVKTSVKDAISSLDLTTAMRECVESQKVRYRH